MTQLSRGAGRQLGVTGNKAQDEGRQSSHEGGGQAGPARTPSSTQNKPSGAGARGGRRDGRHSWERPSPQTGPVTPAGPAQEPCNIKMTKPSRKGLRSHTPSEEAEGEPYPVASNLSPAPSTGVPGPSSCSWLQPRHSEPTHPLCSSLPHAPSRGQWGKWMGAVGTRNCGPAPWARPRFTVNSSSPSFLAAPDRLTVAVKWTRDHSIVTGRQHFPCSAPGSTPAPGSFTCTHGRRTSHVSTTLWGFSFTKLRLNHNDRGPSRTSPSPRQGPEGLGSLTAPWASC